MERRDVAQPGESLDRWPEVVPEEAGNPDDRDDRVDERAAPGRGTDGDGQGSEERAQERELEAACGEVRRADLAELGRAGDRQERQRQDGADDEHPDDEGGEALGQDGPPRDRMGERQVETTRLLIAGDRRPAQRRRHDDDQCRTEQSERRRPEVARRARDVGEAHRIEDARRERLQHVEVLRCVDGRIERGVADADRGDPDRPAEENPTLIPERLGEHATQHRRPPRPGSR